jgi:hypothetical protein
METPALPFGATAPEVTSRSVDPQAAAATVTDVAYIGGAGRSGSTVLALLLGEIPGFLPVGGVNNLWERGLQENYLCGCGSHFRNCAFWEAVGDEAFGGWDAVDVAHILKLKVSVTRYRHSPWHLAPRLRPSFQIRLLEYSDYLARVYRAIKTVSGCTVVVDNSHDIMPALLLPRMSNIRGQVLHLVRDSRGVAFSLSKRVLRPEATMSPTYMARYNPFQASGEWVLANLPYHAVPASVLPRLRVHYESLAASPAAVITRIAEFLGSDPSPADVSHFEGGSVAISDNHMVSGNPHRVGRKLVEIRLDDEWQTGMNTTDRMIVTLLTAPLGLAYGYVGPRSSPSTRAGS